MALDGDAISSRQLYTLDTALLSNPVYSEFPNLTRYICKNGCLKILRLRKLNQYAEEEDIEGDGPQQFRLGNGVVMPSLEEFVIDFCYDADAAHMRDWVKSMDWTCMKRLGVPVMGPAFFEAITGLVPQLKCLKVKLHGEVWDGYVATMMLFVEPIQGLEEMLFENDRAEGREEVWSGILRKHGGSLRKVGVNWIEKDKEDDLAIGWRGWDIEHVQQLFDFAPKLQDLSIELALVKDLNAGEMTYVWVSRFFHFFFLLELMSSCILAQGSPHHSIKL
jgi:hypothetical protein